MTGRNSSEIKLTAQLVLAAEDARYAALIAGDVSELNNLLGEDLVYHHSNGLVDNKAGIISAISSGMVSYLTMKRGKCDTRIYGSGEIGIITGNAKYKVTVDKEEVFVSLSFHSIWAWRDKGAEFVSWQATLTPEL